MSEETILYPSLFEDDYITSNKSIVEVKTYLGRAEGQSSQSFGGSATTSITCDGKKKRCGCSR